MLRAAEQQREIIFLLLIQEVVGLFFPTAVWSAEIGQVSTWEHPAALRADSQLLLQRAFLMPSAKQQHPSRW